MHITAEPNILYFGTPVVLIASSNVDGSPNLAPMSSAFWLGWRCMLGLGAASQTAQNLLRWTSQRAVKENFVPPTSVPYPHMEEE